MRRREFNLRRPNSQGREGCRFAYRAANQVRVRDQPEDCKGAWPRRAARTVIECRRDHRMRPFEPVRLASSRMRPDFRELAARAYLPSRTGRSNCQTRIRQAPRKQAAAETFANA
jgi:hypothetical protein